VAHVADNRIAAGSGIHLRGNVPEKLRPPEPLGLRPAGLDDESRKAWIVIARRHPGDDFRRKRDDGIRIGHLGNRVEFLEDEYAFHD
jgi:hypothetical protein